MSEVVVTRYELDIADAEKNLEKIVKGMGALDKSTDAAEEGTKDLTGELGSASQKLKVLDTTSKQTTKGLKELGSASSGVGAAFKGVGKELGAAFPALGRVTGAVQKLGIAFKAALGPVGLIIAGVVAALGFLLKAFFGTQEGADQLRKVTAFLEIAFDRLIGAAQRAGKAIVDAFGSEQESALEGIGQSIQDNLLNRIAAVGKAFELTKDIVVNTAKGIAAALEGIFDEKARAQAEEYFAAAGRATVEYGNTLLTLATGVDDVFGKIGSAVGGIQKEFEEATKAAETLRTAEIALRKAKIAQAAEQGKLNRLFQEQVQISQDVNKSAEERTEAAKAAIAAQDRLATLQKAVVQQELNILNIKAAQNDTDDEALLIITQKKAELEQIDADRLSGTRRVQNVINGIEKQIADQRIAEAKRAEEEARKLQEAREQGQGALDAFLAEKRKERELADASELERRVFLIQDAAAKEIEEARKLADALRAISEETDLPGIKAQEAEAILLIEQQLAADLAAVKAGADEAELERLAEQQAARLDLLKSTADEVGEVVTGLADGSIETAEDASKALLKIALDTAEKQALIAVANATTGSLATPQSIATGGAAGIAQAAILAALIKGAFALLKSQIAGSFYEGGIVGKDGGTKMHNGRDGYLIRAHQGEHIMPTDKTKKYLPYLEMMRDGQFEKFLNTTAQLNSYSTRATSSTAAPGFNDRRIVGALSGISNAREQRKQTELLALVASGLRRGTNARYTA
jgi:hypothetical protein